MKLKTKEMLSVIEYEKSLTKKELRRYRIAAICFTSIALFIILGSIISMVAIVWFFVSKV